MVFAVGGGFAISMGGIADLVVVMLAGCAVLWVLGATLNASLAAPYILVSAGVCLIAANGVRLTPSLTVSGGPRWSPLPDDSHVALDRRWAYRVQCAYR